MKHWILAPLALAASACGGPDKVADNAVAPDLNMMTATEGDWSGLSQAVGRTPAESGLLQGSDISVDLNALLGPDVEAFRLALGNATPLAQEDGVLVTIGRSGNAYLVIDTADHAVEAGLKRAADWQQYRTPGSDVVLPPSVQRLLAR
jgi:hypothetical protein